MQYFDGVKERYLSSYYVNIYNGRQLDPIVLSVPYLILTYVLMSIK